jgi:hypothetical protein
MIVKDHGLLLFLSNQISNKELYLQLVGQMVDFNMFHSIFLIYESKNISKKTKIHLNICLAFVYQK